MKSLPSLKFHDKCCFTCRYYRLYLRDFGSSTECIFLGRMLSTDNSLYPDRARVCDGWKKRPLNWGFNTKVNPHWTDCYIPRETQIKLRKRWTEGKW